MSSTSSAAPLSLFSVPHSDYVLDLAQLSLADVGRVGGKNASLGELFRALKPRGVGVLDGFATTADGYATWLVEQGIDSISLNPDVAITTTQRVAQAERKVRSARDDDSEAATSCEINEVPARGR
jgi:phosphoenolpyruvate synthase/pyruvate phosphate dikinase